MPAARGIGGTRWEGACISESPARVGGPASLLMALTCLYHSHMFWGWNSSSSTTLDVSKLLQLSKSQSPHL